MQIQMKGGCTHKKWGRGMKWIWQYFNESENRDVAILAFLLKLMLKLPKIYPIPYTLTMNSRCLREYWLEVH